MVKKPKGAHQDNEPIIALFEANYGGSRPVVSQSGPVCFCSRRCVDWRGIQLFRKSAGAGNPAHGKPAAGHRSVFADQFVDQSQVLAGRRYLQPCSPGRPDHPAGSPVHCFLAQARLLQLGLSIRPVNRVSKSDSFFDL